MRPCGGREPGPGLDRFRYFWCLKGDRSLQNLLKNGEFYIHDVGIQRLGRNDVSNARAECVRYFYLSAWRKINQSAMRMRDQGMIYRIQI